MQGSALNCSILHWFFHTSVSFPKLVFCMNARRNISPNISYATFCAILRPSCYYISIQQQSLNLIWALSVCSNKDDMYAQTNAHDQHIHSTHLEITVLFFLKWNVLSFSRANVLFYEDHLAYCKQSEVLKWIGRNMNIWGDNPCS